MKKTAKRSTRAGSALAPQSPAPKITLEQEQAVLQAVLYDNAVAEISAMRERLLAGDCPAAIPAGERQAAAVDLARALSQLNNLQRYYWKGTPTHV